MKHAATKELFAYWERLRGSRSAPERTQIDPAAIRRVLSDTFILEVDAEHKYPFRIAGTRASAFFSRELKGTSFLDLWLREDRPLAQSLIDAVLSEVLPAVAGLAGSGAGREPVEIELLLLPLRHNGRTHARLMGCYSAAQVPSWLGLVPLEGFSFRSLRILRERETAVESVAEKALPAEILSADPQNRRGHLTVYRGGRQG